MYIDTRSREGMEKSIAVYLDVSVDELYQYIDFAAEKAQEVQWAFNTDIFFEELETIISDLQPEIEIDELLFFICRVDFMEKWCKNHVYHALFAFLDMNDKGNIPMEKTIMWV